MASAYYVAQQMPPITETTRLISAKEGVNQLPAWALYLIITTVVAAVVASIVIAFVVQRKTKDKIAARAAVATPKPNMP